MLRVEGCGDPGSLGRIREPAKDGVGPALLDAALGRRLSGTELPVG